MGEMGSWSWGPLLWIPGLPTGTVDGTEERDLGEDALELEGVDPQQRYISVRVLEMGLCMLFEGSGSRGSSIQMAVL